MTARKKLTIQTIGVWVGTLVPVGAIMAASFGFTLKQIDRRIDERIEYKTAYIQILLRSMASDEEKQRADAEYKRWIGDK